MLEYGFLVGFVAGLPLSPSCSWVPSSSSGESTLREVRATHGLSLTASWLIKSVAALSLFSVLKQLVIVFLLSWFAFISCKVFITRWLYSVSAGSSSSFRLKPCISGICLLEWIRIHAWGACDPGFKSQRPHHP